MTTLTPAPQARSRTRRQPRGSSWTCTHACTLAVWMALTGARRARGPGASSATTRAPRTHRTSARSSRTCGTRCWPATSMKSTCCDPDPSHPPPGLRPVRGRRDLVGGGGAQRAQMPPVVPGPGDRRATSESGMEGQSPPLPSLPLARTAPGVPSLYSVYLLRKGA